MTAQTPQQKRSVQCAQVLRELSALADPAAAHGMARFGIRTTDALGISIPQLRKIAKRHPGDHSLALELWESGIHEGRLLAAFVDDPKQVTAAQMERWVRDFDSWDVCDQVCGFLFDRTPFARAKARVWSGRRAEFVKRAGFVLMAGLAVHDKQAPDSVFTAFLPILRRQAVDPRNFVRKAVNWALRQIGKRNRPLHAHALRLARDLAHSESASARWVGSDARRELENVKFVTRNRK